MEKMGQILDIKMKVEREAPDRFKWAFGYGIRQVAVTPVRLVSGKIRRPLCSIGMGFKRESNGAVTGHAEALGRYDFT